MSRDRNKKLFRAWYGFRLIFTKGVMLPLDDELIPRFRSPIMNPSQKGFASHNVADAMRDLPDDSFWLFAFSTAMQNRGSLPHPFSLEMSEVEIGNMHKHYQKHLRHDFNKDIEMLRDIGDVELQMHSKAGKTRLVNMVATGELSMMTMMKYHTEVAPVDYTDLKGQRSFVAKRIYRLINMSIGLEMNNQITAKMQVIQNKLL